MAGVPSKIEYRAMVVVTEMDALTLRERNKQRVRDRILGAMFELFRNVGYNQTTMDDIAEKAEISRGTLFNYFPTKDSLLRPFLQEIFQTRIRPAVNVYLTEQHTTRQALRFLFMNVHEHVLNIPDIEQAFKQEFLRPRDVSSDESKRAGGIFDMILTVLHYGQERGEVRTDMTPEKLARYVGVLYVSIFYSMIMDTESKFLDYAGEIDVLLAFVESGLSPEAITSS